MLIPISVFYCSVKVLKLHCSVSNPSNSIESFQSFVQLLHWQMPKIRWSLLIMIDIKVQQKRDYIYTTLSQHFIWGKKAVENDRREEDLCHHPYKLVIIKLWMRYSYRNWAVFFCCLPVLNYWSYVDTFVSLKAQPSQCISFLYQISSKSYLLLNLDMQLHIKAYIVFY